jgi:hypothetical protein
LTANQNDDETFKIIKKESQPNPRELDLYELLPRFMDDETYVKERFLKPVQREFEWEGETFQLYINLGLRVSLKLDIDLFGFII